MPRNYGLTSGRDVGGFDHLGRSHIAPDLTQREFESFAADLPFPRGYFAQLLIDIATLFIWILFGCLGVIAVGGPFLALGWILFLS